MYLDIDDCLIESSGKASLTILMCNKLGFDYKTEIGYNILHDRWYYKVDIIDRKI